jgi:hypothetical protein
MTINQLVDAVMDEHKRIQWYGSNYKMSRVLISSDYICLVKKHICYSPNETMPFGTYKGYITILGLKIIFDDDIDKNVVKILCELI